MTASRTRKSFPSWDDCALAAGTLCREYLRRERSRLPQSRAACLPYPRVGKCNRLACGNRIMSRRSESGLCTSAQCFRSRRWLGCVPARLDAMHHMRDAAGRSLIEPIITRCLSAWSSAQWRHWGCRLLWGNPVYRIGEPDRRISMLFPIPIVIKSCPISSGPPYVLRVSFRTSVSFGSLKAGSVVIRTTWEYTASRGFTRAKMVPACSGVVWRPIIMRAACDFWSNSGRAQATSWIRRSTSFEKRIRFSVGRVSPERTTECPR